MNTDLVNITTQEEDMSVKGKTYSDVETKGIPSEDFITNSTTSEPEVN